jgi:1-phosphatidylinositol-3-phosphate 5-kinase
MSQGSYQSAQVDPVEVNQDQIICPVESEAELFSDQFNYFTNRSDDEDEYNSYNIHQEIADNGVYNDVIDQDHNNEINDTTAISEQSVENLSTNDTEGKENLLEEPKITFEPPPIYDLPMDVEDNRSLWLPPPAEEGEDDREALPFDGEDDDDDNAEDFRGEWGYLNEEHSLSNRDKSNEIHRKAMKNVVDGHFRALILQLLQVENLTDGENGDQQESWLDIITCLSWEAATLLKPDTSKGGGMDPGGYVKVKCIPCGNRSQSMVVRGVVCKKNVANRRMTSKIDKPKFLILGGALEYQRVANHLSSFDTLLQQEKDHLKMAVAKIDAHHPNVLLVEKSVSRYAQDYLLAKDISLVLNIKRPLLERIARCTGAQIVPSIDHLTSQKLGYCDFFHVEKFLEEHINSSGQAAAAAKKSIKTLMFFEGCPKPLGCTILLKGGSEDQLKKVKHVVQYGVFAAYHLALETSFLADEGASLPELPLKSPITVALPDKPSNIIDRSISIIPNFTISQSSQKLHQQTFSPKDYYDFSTTPQNSLSSDYAPVESKKEPTDDNVVSEQDYYVFSNNNNQQEPSSAKDEFPPSPSNNHQSILVSLSTRCIWKKTVCDRAHLMRIKYYGSFDMPLGRFLRDNMFDKSYRCESCEMPSEAHVHCYTHQQGSLTISVKKITESTLSGEKEGKIWMWHRCLRCPRAKDGLPPATKRVVMSDAAWGLSFGKFLELSFSNHAAASRVANCGHSLHRDCLRFYGFGRMVACFRYASIDVHSVYLPPAKIEYNYSNQEWIQNETNEVHNCKDLLFAEVCNALRKISEKILPESLSRRQINEVERMLQREKSEFEASLQQVVTMDTDVSKPAIDILEINKLRKQLIFLSYTWDQRLIYLSTLADSSHQEYLMFFFPEPDEKSCEKLNDIRSFSSCGSFLIDEQDPRTPVRRILSEGVFPTMENLSKTLDSAWTGESLSPHESDSTVTLDKPIKSENNQIGYSFGLPLPAKGPYVPDKSTNWLRIPFSKLYENYTLHEGFSTKIRTALYEYNPVYVLSYKDILRQNGARLLLPAGLTGTVIPIYDDEPTSSIAYALMSSDYKSLVSEDPERFKNVIIESSLSLPIFDAASLLSLNSTTESASSLSADDSSSSESSKSVHKRVSFTDDGPQGKVKYMVTCYYAKRFESLRSSCCRSELEFIRSIGRCKKWGAQGGKSNVFFAKTLDDRFIIKQVTKTELESFIKFAPDYFKYLSESISMGSPTCLAKILGIYQVTLKHLKGGKESKMDVLVMENLLFRRNITRIYDLKGSARSRYNPDSSGSNKVLLDQNLIEAMPTCPIFVGNKAKRLLERAVWNDTAFLASADVMDYSLLVGVDEENHELVVGIIDFMRQYTWDKHLETWVKASGILGGPKNAPPTVISPMQYKKRFRKAMSTYFLMVPDQWSPPTIIPSRSQSDLSQSQQDDNNR